MEEYNYTQYAKKQFRSIFTLADFEDNDSAVIFSCLKDQMRIISFGDYLKRYIYQKAEIPRPFSAVSDKEYQSIIVDSFKENYTPKSFHDTSAKLSVLAKGWLARASVDREVVFLLAFGLRMSVPDVTGFLVKALQEQDFNFNDADEVIYWYCIHNRLRAAKARELQKFYRESTPLESAGRDYDGTSHVKRAVLNCSDDDSIKRFLMGLKRQQRQYAFSQTALHRYNELLEHSRQAVRSVYREENQIYSDRQTAVNEAELEKMIYSGVPVNRMGNLKPASASALNKQFHHKRLTRQRMSSIAKGKTPVSRFDLITLQFFITSQTDISKQPKERCMDFIRTMNETLESCFMGGLNIVNAYESFVLMCLLTETPLAAFSDVWELSYGELDRGKTETTESLV